MKKLHFGNGSIKPCHKRIKQKAKQIIIFGKNEIGKVTLWFSGEGLIGETFDNEEKAKDYIAMRHANPKLFKKELITPNGTTYGI